MGGADDGQQRAEGCIRRTRSIKIGQSARSFAKKCSKWFIRKIFMVPIPRQPLQALGDLVTLVIGLVSTRTIDICGLSRPLLLWGCVRKQGSSLSCGINDRGNLPQGWRSTVINRSAVDIRRPRSKLGICDRWVGSHTLCSNEIYAISTP